MAPPLLRLQNLSKQFENEIILADINLTIEQGTFISLLGPSGCGKTTLLRLIAGFETPSTGKILYKDQDITFTPPQQRDIHTVFQNYALFPHMTVFENVAFSLRAQSLPEKNIRPRVEQALSLVNLGQLGHRLPESLSGGQQQRVAIARAIINKPQILLLDESLSALDAQLRKQMQIELKQLQRQLGITFIYVTHSQEEALSMSDKMVLLNEGKIQQVGTPRNIYETPKNLSVAKFIGEINVFDVKVNKVSTQTMTVNIEGLPITINNNGNYLKGDKIHFIVRPEDLRVWREYEVENTDNMLPGVIEEIIYKGSTVELLVKLNSGKLLSATEFFDEDDEDLDYSLGENVWVHWLTGWEVILPYETKSL